MKNPNIDANPLVDPDRRGRRGHCVFRDLKFDVASAPLTNLGIDRIVAALQDACHFADYRQIRIQYLKLGIQVTNLLLYYVRLILRHHVGELPSSTGIVLNPLVYRLY